MLLFRTSAHAIDTQYFSIERIGELGSQRRTVSCKVSLTDTDSDADPAVTCAHVVRLL